MIRKLFIIISVVSGLALFSSCADTSLKYTWINDDSSYIYNIEATLTVKDDAWTDGYLREDEVLSWSMSTDELGWGGPWVGSGSPEAGSSNPASSFHGFTLISNGLGSFEVHFPRVTEDQGDNMDHNFLHWIVMEQYDWTVLDIGNIPMTFRWGISNPIPHPTPPSNSGRFVRQIPPSNPPSPPTGLQLPREEVQEVEVQRP